MGFCLETEGPEPPSSKHEPDHRCFFPLRPKPSAQHSCPTRVSSSVLRLKNPSWSNVVSNSLWISSGRRCRAGPGLLASPTRTPHKPYLEMINFEWPTPRHWGPNTAASLGRRSNLSDQTTDMSHQSNVSELHCVPKLAVAVVEPNLQILTVVGHGWDVLCSRRSIARPLAILDGTGPQCVSFAHKSIDLLL